MIMRDACVDRQSVKYTLWTRVNVEKRPAKSSAPKRLGSLRTVVSKKLEMTDIKATISVVQMLRRIE
jgi:ribosomal protein L31E